VRTVPPRASIAAEVDPPVNDDDDAPWKLAQAVAIVVIGVAAVLGIWLLASCAIAIGDNSQARVNTSAPVEVEARADNKREEPKR